MLHAISLHSLRVALGSRRGASMVEYALLIGCVGAVAAAGAKLLGLTFQQGAAYLAAMV